MTGRHAHTEAETRALLRELWSTPVGRRWLLKAGLGSAAAAAVGTWSTPLAEAARRVHGETSGVRLQFALGAGHQISDMTLLANGRRFPLVAHTAASRRALRADGGLWAKMDLTMLTHSVDDVPLPTDQALSISVVGFRGHREVVVSQLWHCPQEATLALARATHRLKRGSLGSVLGSGKRLAALGIRATDVRSPEEVTQLSTIVGSYTMATAMVMHHPNVATKDPTAAAVTTPLLEGTPEVGTLGGYIDKMQRGGRDPMTMAPVTDKDGRQSVIKVGEITTPFKTVELNRDDRTFVEATRSALTAGVRAVRDNAELGAVVDKPLEDQPPEVKRKTWVQPLGVTPRPVGSARSRRAGAELGVKVKNPGQLFGTVTKVTGGYQNGKVPLKVYNNWVRWVWVYVQYLGKDGTNLSFDPNAKFPDTQHARSLGLVPQVFTVVGVPVVGTNSIDVTLEFPEGAHMARLLYCGLGSDILGGGWRQYFPDAAYRDRIAPTDLVTVPALLTGILSIGVTAFALASAANIAAAWPAIANLTVGTASELEAAFAALTNGAIALTASEAFATAVASGAATYEDITNNGGSLSNLWNLLLGLASIIPKLIFNPKTFEFWGKVSGIILSEEAADKVLAAIPFVGEVIGIVAAVGDALTLAEACTEAVVSPWVIENEVSLTYPVSVTISHDQRLGPNGTFPATAKSWRLEALVDGALVLDPITGSINPDGTVQSKPVQVDAVTPFGGKSIQWSVVFLDGAGQQVATGVSPAFANDDPDHLPSEVAFSITQLPATITASTAFKRAATTTFRTEAHGYSWSDRVVVTRTVANSGIQEVTGAAVATKVGVAGMVWKEGDKYYLRGVPVAQNGATIKLGKVRKEGYARQPFLLFDSFVEKGDEGNHVLLEPDETTPAYHVRKLILDPETGGLDWDPTISLGMFQLPVSAAALHSSGKVVAVHSDSGRVGWLQPVATPLPQLAAYSAGPGTQVGLLSSPIALAVTNPGTMLVLEADGPQLAAFDLNGNPVQYFGAPTNKQFTQVLEEQKTYLDLAVDGAEQIYLLCHTGDGSRPEDYRLDVHNPDGTPLDTGSAGVNVPRLAVDYWRSIFAPNYEPLTDLGTSTPHLDPALGVEEPSLSRFDPTNPTRTRRPAPTIGLG